MKMTKLLATGTAAMVAVASLASVASAAEQTFDMAISYGKITVKNSAGLELGEDWCLSQERIDKGETLGISADQTLTLKVSKDFDTVDYEGVVLKVTGVKGKKGTSPKTYTYKFDKVVDNKEYSLKVYGGDNAPADAFLPSQFVEITSVSVEISGTHNEESQDMYNKLGDKEWGYWSEGSVISGGTEGIAKLICTITPWGAKYDSKVVENNYPFIAKEVSGRNNTLMRQDIQLLSYAGAWTANSNNGQDGDQSYDDDGLGTNPKEFAGLASQVGDFFNKQTNGTITFRFTTASATTGTSWNNGGIPSTQVGIKNLLGDSTANDFALFFNYDQTGSLQAVASIDADSGEVSFDISDVLDDLGGQTKGVIDNIFFGLAKGVKYTDKTVDGLKVETVTLAYDEDSTDADIEDDTADDDDDVEDDDDTTIDDDADDDDDTTIDDDDDDDTADDDDDATVDAGEDDANGDAGDTVIVKPSGEDTNPNTGVALAVVPAAIAAAAVVVSKKRK